MVKIDVEHNHGNVLFPRESLILECYTLKCATLKLFAGGTQRSPCRKPAKRAR